MLGVRTKDKAPSDALVIPLGLERRIAVTPPRSLAKAGLALDLKSAIMPRVGSLVEIHQ